MIANRYFSILFFFFTLVITSQTQFEAGKIQDDKVLMQYGIYVLGNNTMELDQIKSKIAKNYTKINIITSIPERDDIKGMNVLITEILNVKEEFTAPDLEYLKYKNLGMTDLQMNAMQKSSQVFVFQFVFEQGFISKMLKSAHNLLSDLGQQNDIIIYDMETRESISEDYWHTNRLIKDKDITVARHITIHFYQKNDYCRAITLGMSKFGLPDICIENLSCRSNDDLMTFVNLIAQTLFEKGKIDKKGKLFLKVNDIKNNAYKALLLDSMYDNAIGEAEVDIVYGTWEEGDPENVLLEIAFPKKDTQVKQMQVIKDLFGSEDEVSMISHDELLLKASEDAKAKIPKLYAKFNKGLELNSHLLLKLPFDEDGQREWMWVEVVKWEDDIVYGLLQNEPRFIKSIKAGQQVQKDVNEMFDYVLYKADGSYEGNETGKIMMKRQKN